MSDPMYPPPPPPGMAPPPMPPMGAVPAGQQVQGPAMFLMVAGGLGIFFQLCMMVLRLIGMGGNALGSLGNNPAAGRYFSMMAGGMGIVIGVLMIAVYAFVIYGAMQMKVLRNWNLSLAASILAMLPCSCCCLLGLPAGIWALIVLMKPEVKGAFVG